MSNSMYDATHMMCAFSRKIPAQDALNKYRESIKIGLKNDGTNHVIVKSIESQSNQGNNADFITASVQSSKVMNKELKDPS